MNCATLKKNLLLFLTILILTFFIQPDFVRAGFGISPPWIKNQRLAPGSSFEQIIYLSQSDPKEDLNVVINIKAPDIQNWIQVNPGTNFLWPKGRQELPVKFTINVPQDAGYGIYRGAIAINAVSPTPKGQITLSVGAQADILLNVSGEQFSDFQIRSLNIPPLEENWPIEVAVKLENLGNVQTRPSRIWIDVYDNYGTQILKSGEISNMSWVKSFQVGESFGKIDLGKLDVGQYWAELKIYKFVPGDPSNQEALVLSDKIRFNVVPEGSLKPISFFRKITKFITASTLHIIISTFTATAVIIGIIASIIIRKIKRKIRNLENRK